MGEVAPLSVLLVGLFGMVIIAVAVVRIALLERKVLVSRPTPLSPVTTDADPWALPGAAAA
ncbi:hypothetical protein [Nocardioides aurantiacus]|uniref:Uncharacterized protein n=1 Tax=Nocardioides aurantiacus TaxID=86796 RepID=A0A3N2CRN1_9ACTN|nr:hypothetical protein [Nocardioides aurantiacus]ROR90018.1 hypothetical protein EDD33_0851 [Nocardioides aurantiacus]